ncbi:MAG: nucleoid-associated protein [Peptococcaceae bacterium]|nr:nucleoid-associated protein [Peptococcaceae bacterium]
MIEIKEAILHVYDGIGVKEVLSDAPLDPRSAVMQAYLEHHIERGLGDPSASHAQFAETSAAPAKVRSYADGADDLVDFSKWIAGLFFGELRELGVEDNYHLIVCRFQTELGAKYAGILALADKVAYTHQIETDEEGHMQTEIAIHRSIMPQPTQRVKGYAFINLEDLGVRVFDIAIKHEKEKIRLFEEVVLGLYTEPSSRESYKQIRQMALAVADEYSQDGVEVLARAKQFLADNAEQTDIVETKALAEKTFPNSIQMQNSFMGEATYANLPDNLIVEQEFARKQTASYKLVCDGEVTLTLPAEWYEDPTHFEMRMESDGTTTITLRGIEAVTSK